MTSDPEKIENLDLSLRAINALKRLNIRTVSDLMNRDLEKIRNSMGVGKKTFAEIAEIIDRSDKIFKSKSAPKPPEPTSPICSVIDAFLLKIKDRNREIFVKRIGLFDEKKETLESIGSRFGLTRERVRQIEGRTRLKLSRLIRQESKGILNSIFRQLSYQTILSTEEIINIYQNLVKKDFKFSKNAVVNLIMEAIGNEVTLIDSSENLWTISRVIANDYPDIIRAARKLLSGLTIDLESLAIEVSREIGLREKVGVELIKKLLSASTRFLRVVDFQGEESFNGISPKRQSLASRRKDFAYFYLKRQGGPVNVAEIFRAMQEEESHLLSQKGGLPVPLHVLDANLERDERLAWAGNSIYALVEWGYEHEVRSIDKVIERLLRQVGRPMNTHQIRDRILELYKISPSSISAALTREEGKRFRRIGEGIWTLI
jgi:hypothetical protein